MPHRPLAQGPSSRGLAADPLVAEPVPVAGELETGNTQLREDASEETMQGNARKGVDWHLQENAHGSTWHVWSRHIEPIHTEQATGPNRLPDRDAATSARGPLHGVERTARR